MSRVLSPTLPRPLPCVIRVAGLTLNVLLFTPLRSMSFSSPPTTCSTYNTGLFTPFQRRRGCRVSTHRFKEQTSALMHKHFLHEHLALSALSSGKFPLTLSSCMLMKLFFFLKVSRQPPPLCATVVAAASYHVT